MTITIVSIAIIFLVFFYCCYRIKKAVKNDTFRQEKNIIEYMPSVLTTFGVLGTFIGITYGLSDFNTTNISASISVLLSGLKMAFWTSIVGMVCSIVVSRWINSISDDIEATTPSTEQDALNRICVAIQNMSQDQNRLNATIEKMVNQSNTLQTRMINLLDQQTTGIGKIVESQNGVIELLSSQTDCLGSLNDKVEEIVMSNSKLMDVHTEIVGIHNISTKIEEEARATYSQLGEVLDIMSTQVGIQEENLQETKNLSTTVRGEIIVITDAMEKGNKLMQTKFDEFSALMRKNNVESLVKVMEGVTKEFNKSLKELINKLVQENFEQLNKSVEQLNVWQVENKDMISELTSQYNNMTSEFKATSTVLEEVADNTHSLIADDSHLKRLIEELQKVLIDDTKFEEITVKLNDTISKVHEGTEAFDEATKELNTWIRNHKDMGDGVRLLVKKLDEINKIKDYNEEFWRETRKNMNEGLSIIANASKSLNSSVSTLNEEFYERLNNTLANLDACIQAMYDNKKRN